MHDVFDDGAPISASTSTNNYNGLIIAILVLVTISFVCVSTVFIVGKVRAIIVARSRGELLEYTPQKKESALIAVETHI